jgi:hypothetical protein
MNQKLQGRLVINTKFQNTTCQHVKILQLNKKLLISKSIRMSWRRSPVKEYCWLFIALKIGRDFFKCVLNIS